MEGTLEVTRKKTSKSRDVFRRFKKNKTALAGLIFIGILIICAIIPSLIAPYGIDEQNLGSRLEAPSKEHLFGTDDFGRDIFSRVIFGARISLIIGLISVSISASIGITLGCISGFYGGRIDNAIMRFIDIMLAIPNILLAMSIVAMLGNSFINLIIAIGIGTVPEFSRIVRASVLDVKDEEYIEAARSIGASDLRIILKHILPNCMAPIIVQGTLSIAISILSAASLSFIGLGVSPPTPEWGSMLSSGRPFIRDYWWVVTFPGVAIVLSVLSFNLFGDGLRDALDPRLKN